MIIIIIGRITIITDTIVTVEVILKREAIKFFALLTRVEKRTLSESNRRFLKEAKRPKVITELVR